MLYNKVLISVVVNCCLLLLPLHVGGFMLGPFCSAVLGVLLSLAIILLRKRELVALCLCSVSLPRSLPSLIVAFPGHTHILLG